MMKHDENKIYKITAEIRRIDGLEKTFANGKILFYPQCMATTSR